MALLVLAQPLLDGVVTHQRCTNGTGASPTVGSAGFYSVDVVVRLRDIVTAFIIVVVVGVVVIVVVHKSTLRELDKQCL